MKNDQTMKSRPKIPTSKAPVASPAVKTPAPAPVAAPTVPPTAKATAPQAPAAKPLPTPAPAPAVAQAPQRPVTPKPTTPEAVSRREITNDLIALRAYNLWEQQGRPDGREVANWLLAESQLKQEVQSFTA